MWAVSWQAWNVCHATIRWIVRHFSGLRYPATRGIFRQRKVSIPSLSSRYASSRRKPTIWILPHRSESRWQTASVERYRIKNEDMAFLIMPYSHRYTYLAILQKLFLISSYPICLTLLVGSFAI